MLALPGREHLVVDVAGTSDNVPRVCLLAAGAFGSLQILAFNQVIRTFKVRLAMRVSAAVVLVAKEKVNSATVVGFEDLGFTEPRLCIRRNVARARVLQAVGPNVHLSGAASARWSRVDGPGVGARVGSKVGDAGVVAVGLAEHGVALDKGAAFRMSCNDNGLEIWERRFIAKVLVDKCVGNIERRDALHRSSGHGAVCPFVVGPVEVRSLSCASIAVVLVEPLRCSNHNRVPVDADAGVH